MSSTYWFFLNSLLGKCFHPWLLYVLIKLFLSFFCNVTLQSSDSKVGILMCLKIISFKYFFVAHVDMFFLERRMLSACISQQPFRKIFYFASFLPNRIGKDEDVWTAFVTYLLATALEAFFNQTPVWLQFW